MKLARTCSASPRLLLLAGLLTALLTPTACLERREPDGVAPREECTRCHGGMLPAPFEAAPPFSLAGDSEPTARGAGAHEAHLLGNSWSRPIACTECHVVPETTDAPGHIDTYPAEITFMGPVRAFEAEPSFDAKTGTCKETFCHGGSFVGHRPSGGTVTEPQWTATDAAITACDGCHGMPPPAPHPEAEGCSDCHHDLDAERSFLRPELHIDGKVTFYVFD